MNSSLLSRIAGILTFTPAADYSTKRGYTVSVAADTATLGASATVPVVGVILEGGKDINDNITVGILGAFEGTCLMKTSGAITKGARVQQAADGTIVTDAGPGNARVVIGIALETGVSGDLIEVAPLTPMILP